MRSIARGSVEGSWLFNVFVNQSVSFEIKDVGF